jgi:uncharacterized membrane protein
MKKILPYLLGILLVAGGIAHIVNPAFYEPMIPGFIPAGMANILSAIVELAVGILLFLPRYRYWGSIGFLVLMIAFLPIHIWDLLKESPAVGPSPAPEIRLTLQLVLIYAGWWMAKKYKEG